MGKMNIDRTIEKADYTTLDLDRLAMFPVAVTARSAHASDKIGAMCAMDAPGYPTYFLQSMSVQRQGTRYVQYEDGYVIWNPKTNHYHNVTRLTEGFPDAKHFHKLWKPLPESHARVRLWEQAVYVHMQHCYVHPTREKHGKPDILIFPIPYYELLDVARKPKYSASMTDDEKYALYTAYITKIETYTQGLAPYAVPERHLAVQLIRRFYPEHTPIVAWIENVPLQGYEANNRYWESESHE